MSIGQLSEVHPPRPTVVNVASVPMRSPFRYPGGKTWLVPYVRRWLRHCGPVSTIVEPFAGGAIVSLTAVFEELVSKAVLVEIDPDVASVWNTILHGRGDWLAARIGSLHLSGDSVKELLSNGQPTEYEQALATIVRNRISRGGILAPGAGIIKNGENGKGIASRWYPETLQKRILDIVALRHRIEFHSKDGALFLRSYKAREDAVFFIDPPYTVAGRRLYTFSDMDHEGLFSMAADLSGRFLMTYDDAREIRLLAEKHAFSVREVAMKNTHHTHKTELLISRDLRWLDQ